MIEHAATPGNPRVNPQIFPAFARNGLGLDRNQLRLQLPALQQCKQSAHKVRSHENVDSLSSHYLGELACESQVYMFERAVRELNGIAASSDIAPGQMLKLPGISEKGDFVSTSKGGNTVWSPFDGTVVTTASDGTVITNQLDDTTVIITPDGGRFVTSPDGSSTIFQADGTVVKRCEGEETVTTGDGIVRHYDLSGNFVKMSLFLSNGCTMDRTADGEGGVVDTHEGIRKENNFQLFEKQDGTLEVHEENTVLRFIDDDAVKPARTALLQRARATMADVALLSKFKADMIRFENRLHLRSLPADEIVSTYNAVGWLLDVTVAGKVTGAERIMLAQQVLSQCNTPSSIDQGHHNTVCVSAIETRVYTRRPARAAELVSALAMTGRHAFPNGVAVRLTETSLRPDFEAVTNPPIDGKRSFASQLFQVAAVNSVYANRKERIVYEQTTPALSAQAADTGERLYTAAPAALILKDVTPGLSNLDVVESYEFITGDREIDIILEHTDDAAGKDMVYCVGTFSSMEEFSRKLAMCKRKGRLPVLLSLHTGNQPFLEDSGDGTAGGAGGWSVVTVTDFHEKEQLVEIDNQWGSASDHMNEPLTVQVTYLATIDPANHKAARETPTARARAAGGASRSDVLSVV